MSESNHWHPSAAIQTLQARAHLLGQVREYFSQEQVLEVETPILSCFTATDLQLKQWRTEQGYTLHTSPELAMKRLLAAGSGDIFQLCRVFRCDEVGQRHNPEFTMLEWYRIGMDEFDLMSDVVRLIEAVTGLASLEVRYFTYQQAFKFASLLDPHLSSDDELRKAVSSHLNSNTQKWTRDDCLDALMAIVVEPSLPKNQLCFIHQYPKSQAALAQHIEIDGLSVARRFELYWQGMELANGYFELTDPIEQKRRFDEERAAKAKQNRDIKLPDYDSRFLQALEAGMPSCSGVALGFDRLAMIVLEKKSIAEVIAFTFDRS